MNHNKIKALIVSRSRTMNPPHGDLVLSGVSILISPYFDILGMKFDSKLTFEDHVNGIVSCISQRIDILRLVKRIFVVTSVLHNCDFAFVLPILEYCFPVRGSMNEAEPLQAECPFQLLERQVYSVARLSTDQFLVVG